MKRLLILFLSLFLFWPEVGGAWVTQINITGSTTIQPIVEKIAESYIDPGIEFKIIAGGSGNGIKAIIDGTTDIGISSRFIKTKELKYALAKGVYPVPFQIAFDCIIPIVHPQNTVNNLTADQMRNIYAGLITNWEELEGSNLPIKVISRDNSSGTYDIWVTKVMNGEPIIPSAKLERSSQDVVNTVASDLGAIGYVGIGYLNGSVKAVRIDNVEGSAKSTFDGKYFLARPLFMFTRSWPTDETLKFIRFVLDPDHGQKWVQEAGFIPLYQSSTVSGEIPAETDEDVEQVAETPSNNQLIQ